MLIAIAAVITVATLLFPAEVQQVEQEAEHIALQAEQELLDWWTSNSQKPPVPVDDQNNPDVEQSKKQAAERMLQQDSKWVDGEKKLKAKLKVLAVRQAQGMDLGVPVLTRYLGEDIPAWPGQGVDVEEWKLKVTTKYAEMRKEEEEWKRKVSVFMAHETQG
jgi:hypothetical protein